MAREEILGRRAFLRQTTGGTAALMASPALNASILKTGNDAGKPNIIYVFPDQYRADTLGFLGRPGDSTPNLDALSKRGTAFTNCCSNGPLCMPARATMMTGLHVFEHNQWGNKGEVSPGIQSHVRRMRDEGGYKTALIGKAHLNHTSTGVHKRENIPVLNQWGFEYVDEIPGPLEASTRPCAYSDYLGTSLYQVFREYIRDFKNNYHDKNPWDTKAPDTNPWNLSEENHIDSFVGRTAAEWIRSYSDNRPFYLQVNFPGPHDPFDSPQTRRTLFDQDEMPGAFTAPTQGPESPLALWSREKWCNLDNMTEENSRRLQLIYNAKAAMIDDAVGAIVSALVERGLDTNTWILFCSDHGEMCGDHRLLYKIVFYEQSLKVPLVIVPPKGALNTGRRSAVLCDQIDVTQTILDIGGLSPMAPGHGRSLKQQSVVDDPSDTGRDFVLSHVMQTAMIFDGRYKLGYGYENKQPYELYDLQEDPQEEVNRVNDGSMQQIVTDLLGTAEASTSTNRHGSKARRISSERFEVRGDHCYVKTMDSRPVEIAVYSAAGRLLGRKSVTARGRTVVMNLKDFSRAGAKHFIRFSRDGKTVATATM